MIENFSKVNIFLYIYFTKKKKKSLYFYSNNHIFLMYYTMYYTRLTYGLVYVSVEVKEEEGLGVFFHGNICFLFLKDFPKGSQERTFLRLISLRV